LERVKDTDPVYHDLKEVRKAAIRSADLTRQLLAFARKQTVAPKVLDLNATVDGMLSMLRRLIGEDIQLVWMPGIRLGNVLIDPSQVDQIMANLCVNARDAIRDTGRITIETQWVALDAAYCTAHDGAVPGEYIMLAVSDTGCGMDKATQANIFDPFFTTKPVGEGTGLGLSTVYGIVKQNHGYITVYSEVGEGTTFKVFLPLHSSAPADVVEEVQVAPSDSHGKQTVMVVEDEPAILSLAAGKLRSVGYTVLPAGTPAEALRMAHEHGQPIHLLLTDVVMPEMNGQDLAGKLKLMHPELRCIFMSGYTANVIAHHGVLDDGVHFLQKPFTMKALAHSVADALN
ncbi:MAG TPA: hybrid sensor histidine kinase/response regulator, partial [Verrucomicrobia bacterium]|nr:hybrid sensor histidine kinase/response regulator [Verrucomicrobiota bacterium]